MALSALTSCDEGMGVIVKHDRDVYWRSRCESDHAYLARFDDERGVWVNASDCLSHDADMLSLNGSYSENLEREEKPQPCGGDVTSQLVAAAMLLSAFSAKQTTRSQDDVHREEHNVYRKEDNVPNEEHNDHREEHKPSMYIGHSEDMSSISTHCADHCKSQMISRFAVGSTVSHRERDASRHVVPCKRKRDACEELLREEETQKAVKQTRLGAANRLTWFSHTFKRRQAGDNIVISAIRKRAQLLFRRRSANIGAYLSRQVARLL